MRLELLYTQGCPKLQKVRDLLREILQSLGLDLNPSEMEIAGPAKAEEGAFPGSPTIRIDGQDLEPESARTVVSGCRIYKTGTGEPEGQISTPTSTSLTWSCGAFLANLRPPS
jgi:hypothetical protein